MPATGIEPSAARKSGVLLPSYDSIYQVRKALKLGKTPPAQRQALPWCLNGSPHTKTSSPSLRLPSDGESPAPRCTTG